MIIIAPAFAALFACGWLQRKIVKAAPKYGFLLPLALALAAGGFWLSAQRPGILGGLGTMGGWVRAIWAAGGFLGAVLSWGMNRRPGEGP